MIPSHKPQIVERLRRVQFVARFQFKPFYEEDHPDPGPPGWFFAHRAFEMHAFHFGEIHQFNKPLEFTIQYSDQDVVGLMRNSLRLWYRLDLNSPWKLLVTQLCTRKD